MLMHSHRAASQAGSPTYRFNLQAEVLKADRVVPVHRALELQREDQIQIPAAPGYKGAARLRRPHLEAAVELGHVALLQKYIRRLPCRDSRQPQLLRQPALPGAETALAAPSCLRRVSRNHLYPQFAQRSSHLRQSMRIHFPAHLRRQPEMAPPIAVQCAEHALALDHFLQSRHHRQRRFFFHQLGVIDLAAGIVENHDQVIPALVLEPTMPAAVDVQQHTRQRTPWSSLTMHPAFASPLYQSGSLQGQFHPGVAEFNLVLLAELLVKMTHVQIVIALPVQPQNLLYHRQRNPFGRRLSPPPVEQPVIAELFVTFPPAPHVPVADADDLCCLPPRDLLRHGPQDYFLYFHRPLHRGLRVRNHALHGLLPSPHEKRTSHVLSQPDISCANDSADFFTLTVGPAKFTVRVCGNSRIFVKLPSFVFRTANFPPKFDLRIFQGPDTI